MPNYATKGETADELMRAANITDASAQGVIGFERLRRMAQGRQALASQAKNLGASYAKKAGVVGLAIEAGNAVWLASDKDKRARAAADFEETAKKPALERMIEGGLNVTDTLFGLGKAAYDAGKTYESVERSQIYEPHNALLRKIAKHEAEVAKQQQGDSSKPTRVYSPSDFLDAVDSGIRKKAGKMPPNR